MNKNYNYKLKPLYQLETNIIILLYSKFYIKDHLQKLNSLSYSQPHSKKFAFAA